MARVTLNPMFHRLSGNMGRIVHYNRYGQQYCRIHVIPANPRTECQQAVRATFAEAVHSWQQLDSVEKARYNRKARYKKYTGYNLYISTFMKANEPSAQKIQDSERSQVVLRRYSCSTLKASSSVAAPLLPACSPYSSSKHIAHSPGAGSVVFNRILL